MFGEAIKEVSDLFDHRLKEELQKLAGGARPVSSKQSIADVKRNVKHDASEPDARLLILILSASYIELCDKRGLQLVGKAHNAAVKHIVSVLQSPKRKTRVEDALQLEKVKLKNEYFGSMDCLT